MKYVPIKARGPWPRFRWWLFKRISEFGYWVCPEPDRTIMGYLWSKSMKDLNKEADDVPIRKET